MLILAGVSLNAIIGDNGIITRAQEANMQSSIASLEEFLQLKYTENYEEMTKYQSKIEGLTNVCSQYFYIPREEGIGGLRYVIDSDGHALYLIKKSGLPEEIRESLIGGDAGEGSYADYQGLNDVYGVTANLKVYYCSGGVDSIKGLAKESLDKDNPNRTVWESESNVAGFLKNEGFDRNGDGNISAEEAKGPKKLTITKDSNITSFQDFYNFTGLQELTLEEVTMSSLNGLENCSVNYIYLKNCKIDNYSAIGKLGKKLRYLYLYNTTDDEVSKLCDDAVGIGEYDLPNLGYFGIVGSEMYLGISTMLDIDSAHKSSNTISNVDALSNLTDVTKKAIKYLFLQNNNITNIIALNEFCNVYGLRVECNVLETLKGLENMTRLSYLCAAMNKLGNLEVTTDKNEENDALVSLTNNKSLVCLNLIYNPNLIWIDYIKNCVSMTNLYLMNCGKLDHGALMILSTIWFGCSSKSINADLERYFVTEDVLNLIGVSAESSEFKALEEMTTEAKNKVKKLNLSESILSNEELNNTIKLFPNIICLNVNNCSNLTKLDFVQITTKIEQLCFDNTGITGDEVSKLDQYAGSLKSFCCNTDISLDKMQNVISRCDYYAGNYAFEKDLSFRLGSESVLKKLEDCTEILRLVLYRPITNEQKVTVDLSGCDRLQSFSLQSMQNIDFILPTSLKNIEQYWSGGSGSISFCGKVSLELLALRGTYMNSNVSVLFDSLKQYESSIKRFVFQTYNGYSYTTGILKELRKVHIDTIENLGGYYLDSSIFNFDDWSEKLCEVTAFYWCPSNVTNLDFLSNNLNMTTLKMNKNSINDISGIATLMKLQTVDLSENAIKDLSALSNLKNLKTLNLNNNLVEDNQLQVLIDLNKNCNNECFRNLYIKNNQIINPEVLTGVSWTDWSGFGGK